MVPQTKNYVPVTPPTTRPASNILKTLAKSNVGIENVIKGLHTMLYHEGSIVLPFGGESVGVEGTDSEYYEEDVDIIAEKSKKLCTNHKNMDAECHTMRNSELIFWVMSLGFRFGWGVVILAAAGGILMVLCMIIAGIISKLGGCNPYSKGIERVLPDRRSNICKLSHTFARWGANIKDGVQIILSIFSSKLFFRWIVLWPIVLFFVFIIGWLFGGGMLGVIVDGMRYPLLSSVGVLGWQFWKPIDAPWTYILTPWIKNPIKEHDNEILCKAGLRPTKSGKKGQKRPLLKDGNGQVIRDKEDGDGNAKYRKLPSYMMQSNPKLGFEDTCIHLEKTWVDNAWKGGFDLISDKFSPKE